MIRIAALLLCVASFSVAAPLALDNTSSSRHSLTPLEVSKSNIDQTSITLRSPEITIQDSILNFETFQYPNMPGEPVLYREGYPAVPHVTRLYRIPNTGGVQLVVNNLNFTTVDNLNVLPVQKEQDRFESRADRAPEVYGQDAWYPAEPYMMSEPKIWRDFRIVEVSLFPVQVNPVTGQARIYDEINVDVVSTDEPGENELLNPRRISGAFKNIYQDLIANLDETTLDEATDTPGQFLIICKDNAQVLPWVDSLATWKRRMGWDVVVNSAVSWTSASVKNTIQTLYNNADPPLEFVCIFGDVGGAYGVPTHGGNSSGNYDHHYAMLDGNDDYEEIGVGRLSAENSTQLSTVVSKVFIYERDPYMVDTTWYKGAFLYAGTSNGVSSNEIMTIWGANQFRNWTGINNPVLGTHAGDVSTALIGQRFNAGICFFLWRGTVVGEMQNNAAGVMNPSQRLPVTLTITCGSGDFDLGTSITEAFLREGTASAPKGGVCGIGTASFQTHVPYNNTMAGGLVYGICNLDMQYLGAAVSAAKAQILQAFPGNTTAAQFTKWNNLMGDPSLSMWNRVPTVINVTYPGTVNVGARRIRPQVTDAVTGEPIVDALCVIWKGDETYARSLTDAGGFVDMPATINTPGTMTLTVTKRNHKPFLADITCVEAAENVTIESLNLDDDNSGGSSGNNDGNLNPGEIIDIAGTAHNFGNSATAQNITSTLTSDNADVVVLNGAASYPNVAPGVSVSSSSAYRIQVSPTMRHDEDVKLTFTINSASQTTFSTIQLTCRAGLTTFVSHVVTGGDGDAYAEPGEVVNLRVNVRNDGALGLTNVTGTLVSRYSLLSVLDNEGTFGDIVVDGTANNQTNLFQIRPNSVAYRGSQGSLLLVLTADGGHVDSVTFNIPIGTATAQDPTGPDAYGYYAYENIDTAFEWTNQFDWDDIAGIGIECNRASQDPGEQSSNGITNSDAIELPFDFMFYGETYDTITVCSNGWAAFGDQSELDMFRNYDIPGSQAPDAMLAPLWDDLKTTSALGVTRYYDQANNKFVIQWNAQNAFPIGGGASEIFQVILLDPTVYPTSDGNGIVIFQYQTVSDVIGDNGDVDYSTIGIAAPRGLVGLSYRHNNFPAPGASTLISGRCVTYTTEASLATGIVTGVVTDFATGDPLAGVEVMMVEEAMYGTTNVLGEFTINDVPIGTYTVRARLFGYNDGVASDFVVEMDSTETVNFSMLHPEITLSTEQITVTLPGDPTETSFSILNNGNGPLDYTMSLEYEHEGEEGGEWSLINHIDISESTSDLQIQGCEFAGDYWFVTGTGPSLDKRIYKFDLLGNYVGWFPQPPAEHPIGWFDMAFDGQYLYGSAQNQHHIYGIDLNGVLQDSIPCPSNLSPARAIAYDPQSDHFWLCDVGTDIYEIDRDGNIINRFQNNLSKWGLGWYANDPLGYKLYVFHREENGNQTVVSRLHPVTGDINLVERISANLDDRSGGCTVTAGWNSTLVVFAGVMQNPLGDRLEIRQLEFDTDWIAVTPMFSSVNPQSSRDITVAIDPENLRDFTYHVNLIIENNSATDVVVLPITLATTLAIDDAPELLPQEYALHQNYPNPFNATTTFAFDLKQSGLANLSIYNLLGQKVATVFEGHRDAGSHTVAFEMNSVASGVYLYRLESGDFFGDAEVDLDEITNVTFDSIRFR